MTVGLGYPDYQDYPNWRGQVYAAGSFSIQSASPKTVAEYVTNYASTYIFCQCTALTGVTLTVTFYTDATESIQCGQMVWVINEGCFVSTIIPNLGNYISVVVSTAAVMAQTATLIISPTGLATAYPVYPTPNTGLVLTGQTCDSSLPYSDTLAQVRDGTGFIYFNPEAGAANYTIIINEMSEQGAIIGAVFKVNAPTGPFTGNFIAGTNPLQINVTSTSATANKIDVTVRVNNV
jgi:hypothetical protein